MNRELDPDFDEVLLTAYLDDEVTDEERALVERQLRTSESSRKLLEELRSVRNLVVQLHMTQPNRSFQQGPWNDDKETVPAPKVVLNDHRASWNTSFRRLASLAALIAIASCVSVLMFGPKRDTMALTDGAKKKVDIALPTENVPQDAPMDSFEFTPAAPSSASSDAAPLAKSRAEDAEAKVDVKQESLGRVATPSGVAMSSGAGMSSGSTKGMSGREVTAAGGRSEGAVRKVESSAGVPGAAGSGASLTEGSGGPSGAGGFSNSAPAKPMAKQKANTADSLRVDPAPAAARMLAESDAGGNELRNEQALVPAQNSTPAELYFFLPLIQQQADGDWLAVEGRMEAADIGEKEDRDLALKEAETSPKITPSETRYTYRFRGTVSNKGKASFDGLELAEQRSGSGAPSVLSLGAAVKIIDGDAKPLVIELQIPEDKWELGSKRLRQMGFDIPLELPQTECLDFIAIQIPKDAAAGQSTTNNTAVNPLEADAIHPSGTLALGKQFRRIDLSRDTLAPKEANVTDAGSKDEREGIEPAGKTRIRVRVLKKE